MIVIAILVTIIMMLIKVREIGTMKIYTIINMLNRQVAGGARIQTN